MPSLNSVFAILAALSWYNPRMVQYSRRKAGSMRITVYYTHRFDECPGGIGLYSPADPGPFRVFFKQMDDDRWALAASRKDPDTGWHVDALLFEAQAAGLVGFRQWLGENVDLIEVDGAVFWANPSIDGDAGESAATQLYVHGQEGAAPEAAPAEGEDE